MSVIHNSNMDARIEAGRQALGLVGRAEVEDFQKLFNNFKEVYKFLKEEFEHELDDADAGD